MKRFALLLALASLLVSCRELPRAAPEAVGLSSERLEAVHALLEEHVDQRKIAGAVALVARHGKVAWLDAVGWKDIAEREPMTADTIFRIASMTKPITTVAVLMLREDGRFELSDPVSRYLPELASPKVLEKTAGGPSAGDRGGSGSGDSAPREVPARREITIHDLLTHTSGLTYGFFGREGLAERYREAGVSDGLVETTGTIGENVERLAHVPLEHHPGSAWEYGLSTDVLGRLVEVVSGMPLDEFFRERIFDPLDMDDTHFFLPARKVPRLATLYAPGDDDRVEAVGDGPVETGNLVYSATFHYLGPRTYFSGGAGLVSTARDYARFLQMLLDGGELDGTRLLEEETVAAMTRNQVGELDVWIRSHGDTFGWGVGVVTEEGARDTCVSEGTYSWGGIFNTYFYVDPERDLLAVLMTQLYPFGHLTIREDFRELTCAAVLESSGAVAPAGSP